MTSADLAVAGTDTLPPDHPSVAAATARLAVGFSLPAARVRRADTNSPAYPWGAPGFVESVGWNW